MLDDILQNIFVGCQGEFIEILEICSIGSVEFLKICFLCLMPPYPSSYPPTKNFKISPAIAYDYPSRAILGYPIESPTEDPRKRNTERFCAF
jgi:hypothetical protein